MCYAHASYREVQRNVCHVQSTSSKRFEHDIPHGNQKKGSEERLFLKTELVLRAEQGESPCQHTLFWSGFRNIPVASSDHTCAKAGYKKSVKNTMLHEELATSEIHQQLGKSTNGAPPTLLVSDTMAAILKHVIFTEGAFAISRKVNKTGISCLFLQDDNDFTLSTVTVEGRGVEGTENICTP